MKTTWEWTLKDLSSVKKNGLKVFSCFSCGGGSTMGYKLAGYDVIGNCEIDEAMNNLYLENHSPKFNFKMDIRKFKMVSNEDLPEELFHLDILDGSPPCSTFSLAGEREDAWGKKKVFREGQTAQTLDDLSFEYIDVAEKLRPRVIILENVKGMTLGNAKGYLNEILGKIKLIGYTPQMFLLNSAFMGVPQRRERIFIIARRNDTGFGKLILNFNEKPITYGHIKSGTGSMLKPSSKYYKYWKQRINSDNTIGDITQRLNGKESGFNNPILHDEQVPPTLTAGGTVVRYSEPCYITNEDMIHMQTFPDDYDFKHQSVQYVCGMSVPPLMMARIAEQINKQWFKI